MEIYNWKDIGFTGVVAKLEDYVVTFQVYKIFEIDGEVQWYLSNSVASRPTNLIDKAEIYLTGHVKWDGCSNWNFDEQDRGVMLHGCYREDLVNIGEVMARCWDIASKICPHWSF